MGSPSEESDSGDRPASTAEARPRWDREDIARAVEGGVVHVGPAGRLVFWSRRAPAILGAAKGFEAAWTFVHECLEREFAADGAPREREFTVDVDLPSDFGARSIYVRIFLLGAALADGYLALFRERRSLDALQADLHAAAQMRRLQSTYRQAAHDLKAPLNALTLNLELLRGDVLGPGDQASPEEVGQRIQLLDQEVRRLSRMLEAVLGQSGLPKDEVRSVDLRRLLREVLSLLRPQARQQKVLLGLQASDKALPVVAQRDHLKQALLNVVVNALEAMPDGGTLAVTLSRAGGRALLRIQDDGVGIAPADLERVFELHFTTKAGGSGIGLFTARAAVQALGGTLRLESLEGRGTTAIVELPASLSAEHEVSCSPS